MISLDPLHVPWAYIWNPFTHSEETSYWALPYVSKVLPGITYYFYFNLFQGLINLAT